MKSGNLHLALMAGCIGLTSLVVAACSDIDKQLEQNSSTERVSFSVSDVQNVGKGANTGKSRAASVWQSHATPIEGDEAQGLQLVETTIEGVLPMQASAATRGTITTTVNFAGINKPFSIFASKNGGATVDYMYNEKVNADGSMVNPVQWHKADAPALKFFAVHPAVDAADLKSTVGQSPIVQFEPKADAKQQTDFLVASTNILQYDDFDGKKIPLVFSHATTAIQFKIGNDLSYNQKVKTIEILGVIGDAKYDVANKAWVLGSSLKNYKLTLNPPFSTAQNPGVVINGGDGTFFMIPQVLPDAAMIKITFESGKYWTAKIGGAGKKWTEGTTRVYTISNSSDLSDRDFELSITPTTDLGDGVTTRKYNELDIPFTVQSFSRLKGYPDGSRDKAEAWEISKYEYSEDGINWTTGKPSMVASVTEQGAGGSVAEACNLRLTYDYKDFKAEREAQLQAAPEVTTRKDLSINACGQRNTANCYVVSAGGKYKFPLVYGNALQNGQDNRHAYRPNVTASNSVLGIFQEGRGNINGYQIKGIDRAQVAWCSEPGLVTISNGGNVCSGFVEFEVDKTKMKEASAIITVSYCGCPKRVAWSWHIWITSQDVLNTNSGYFMLEPLGFRHTAWEGTPYRKDRQVRLTFMQKRSKKIAQIVFTQKPSEMIREGVSMFYQQGRKDPLWPGCPFTVQPYVYNGGLSLKNAAYYPLKMATPRRANSGPSNLGNWDWNTNCDPDKTYFNLWDAYNTTGYQYACQFYKTVYDPSPAGFHVPRVVDFQKIKAGNNGKPAFAPTIGKIDPQQFHNGIVENNEGHYWTSEKYKANEDSYYGYYGLIGLVKKKANGSYSFDTHRPGSSIPVYRNMSWGYSVLPVKE